MAKFIWLLVFGLLLGCEAPQTFPPFGGTSPEGDTVTVRNPRIADPQAHGIPQVAPVIPRNGMWSGYNQLGYQAKYGPDQRGTQTILKLDEWGPPEVWTISLFLKSEFLDSDGFNVQARINFGAGGSTQVMLIDWINGAQISLPMNAVNVEAIFADVDVATEGKGLALGVQLARGSRGGTLPPVLMIAEHLEIAADNESVSFTMPAFAKRVVLMPAANDAANIAAFYSDETQLIVESNPFGSGDVVGVADGAHADNGLIAVTVVGKARSFKIANTSNAVPVTVTLYVELEG